MVIEVWQNALGMDSTEQVTLAQKQLRSIEHPPSTSNTHPKQVNGFKVCSQQLLSAFVSVQGRNCLTVSVMSTEMTEMLWLAESDQPQQ